MTDQQPMRAEVTRAPATLDRDTAVAICELLGVNANTVTRIVLTPSVVEISELVLGGGE